MAHSRSEKIEALGRIIDTLDILRVECPWDKKQTNESLRSNTIEEVYELCEALINDDAQNIKKELGDVLLHILFYSKIGEEQNRFDIADVADALNEKLIFRHPHVFGNTSVSTTQEVEQNWEQIKLKEKGIKELLDDAQKYSLSDIKIATEKLWDALERIKTFFGDTKKKVDKKGSVEILIDLMANGNSN